MTATDASSRVAERESLRRFATRSSARVDLVRWGRGLAVLKRAGDTNLVGSGAGELEAQVRHITVMRGKLGLRSPFPEVLGHGRGWYAMEHVEGPTLAELAPADLVPALRASAALLLDTAAAHPAIAAPEDHLASLLRSRAERLDLLLRERPRVAGVLADDVPALVAVRAEMAALLERRNIGAATTALGPRNLRLAVHSDFVPENVVCTGAGPRFIDPRPSVVWRDGCPWWDPVLDLASFVAFHRDVPAPAGAAGDRDSARVLLEDAYLSSGLAADDAAWRERLRVYVWLRLFGFLSIRAAYVTTGGEAALVPLARGVAAGWPATRAVLLDAAAKGVTR